MHEYNHLNLTDQEGNNQYLLSLSEPHSCVTLPLGAQTLLAYNSNEHATLKPSKSFAFTFLSPARYHYTTRRDVYNFDSHVFT